MTIKEAILQSLEDRKSICTSLDLYKHIIKNKYYNFGDSKTPDQTVSALTGDFIRKGDTRVKRIKGEGGTFSYYLTEYEELLGIDKLSQEASVAKKTKVKSGYDERDLHVLLTTYLESVEIHAKTIYHEKSLNSKDSNQKWAHPDMVGVSFINLQTASAKSLLKAINRIDSLNIFSYELKKEINTDNELKQAFFQALSNSRWAHYGYLVVFEIGGTLNDELERLSRSFGLGVIELSSHPYESRILFPSVYKDLDFSTIDKLCNINKEFNEFIKHADKNFMATETYEAGARKELIEFCDKAIKGDANIKNYCISKNIPYEEEEEELK